MFCPKCELEIKGDDKQECPICGSALVTEGDEVEAPAGDTAEEDLKLQELISDIDSKVQQSLEDNQEGPAGPAETLDLGADGPSLDDFNLDVDSGGGEAEAPVSEKLSLDDSEAAGDLNEIIGALKEETTGEQSDALGSKLDDLIIPGQEKEEAPPAATIEEKFEETITKEPPRPVIDDLDTVSDEALEEPDAEVTKSVLDRALEDLDSGNTGPRHKKKSKMSPVLLIILLLVVAGGGAYYYFTVLSAPEPAPPVPVRTVKKVKKPAAKPVEKQMTAPEKQQAPATVTKQEPPAAAKTGTPEPVKAEKPPVEKKEPAAVALKKEPVKKAEPAKPVERKPVEKKPAVKKPATKKSDIKKAEKPAKAAPVAAPQKEPAPVKKVAEPESYYSVHAGSYRKQYVAEREVARLNKMGFPAYVSSTNLSNKGTWYRVKIGKYETRAEAERVRADLKRRDTIPSRIVFKKK